MQTISIGIMNLCAPCGCACRYCLLRSCKQAEGVDYERGKRLAERFFAWGRDKGLPEPPFYNVGFCAEYPQLLENIAFNRANGWIGARFLQCNGIAIRPEEETDRWLSRIKAAGIERIDTTFFGDRACHDAFAARDGDYDFMLKIYTKDMKQYQQFILKILGDMDCIGSLHSTFVLGEVKNSYQLPL